MAELPGKAKQVPKQQRPSRLRNEVFPESPDDERDRKKPVTEGPSSDAIVPETQPNHEGLYIREDHNPDSEPNYDNLPTSPGAAEFLERTAVTKKADVPTWAPFAWKTPTKEPLAHNNDSPSTGQTAFAFSRLQASKAPGNTFPEGEATSVASIRHPESKTSSVHQFDVQASQDITEIAEPAYVSPSLPPGNDYRDTSNALVGQGMVLFPQTIVDKSQDEPGSPLPIPADMTSDIPPSAQLHARPTSETNRVRVVKKCKNGRKGRSSQQREGQQHPQSSVLARHAQRAMVTGIPVAGTTDNTQRHFQLDIDAERLCASPTDAVQVSAPTEDLHEHIHDHESRLPTGEHGSISHGNDSSNATQTFPDTIFQDFLGSPAQHEFPTSSVRVPSTLAPQASVTEREERSLVDVRDQVSEMPVPREDTALLAQASGAHTFNCHESNAVPEQPPQFPQLEVHANNQHTATRPRDAEAVLHGISPRDTSHRVAKPRRKLRPSGPVSRSVQEHAMSLGVDQSLEKLKVAMLAEKYRVQHEITIAATRHETEIIKLQGTITNQIQTIAERDESHSKLRDALNQLIEKAKANQKFVTGLQQDHENLQKSSTSFQRQNQKALSEKISELENEKKVLYREFGATTDRLATSQRKMKSTLDDVYMRYTMSELKRKHLVEHLDKQGIELKEERRKREDTEKQLLSGVQGIPRQIVSSSDALAKKMESLQTVFETATSHDKRDDQIKECLDALQTLRSTPALTVQDIERMESTLRLLQQRLESGLDTLSEDIKSKPSPNSELQVFIKEQLHGLQTEMLKCEEVTTKNREMQELNKSLKAQLEAQQQHSSRLEEQIKSLQKSEIDLKAQADQLKQDLDELKAAPPVPHVDTSEFEQEALDLRQRLEKVGEQLEAAKTNVETIERERDSIKGYYETAQSQLQRLQQKPVVEDDIAIREQIAKDCLGQFTEKEHYFRSEIHRIKTERDEKEKARQKLSNKLDAMDTHVDELSEKIRTLESESVETRNLQERLQQLTEKLQIKGQDHADLHRQYEEQTKKMSELQGLHDKLQVQIAEQQTTMQTMRQETDTRISKVRQDASNTLRLSHNQISTLEKEKVSLSTQLQQARLHGDKLRQDEADLRVAKEAEESRCQKHADEEIQRLMEQHRTEIDNWKRHLAEQDAALKKAKADARLAEDQHKAKLSADRKQSESNMRKMEQKYNESIRVLREQASLSHQDGSAVQIAKKLTSEPHELTQVAKPRKKVNRENNSVLDASLDQGCHFEKPSWASNDHVSQTQLEDDDLFAIPDEAYRTLIDVDSIDHEPGTATETQDMGSVSISQDIFNSCRPPQQVLKRQASSSTCLSSLSPDSIEALEAIQPEPPAISRGSFAYQPMQTTEETRAVSTAMLRGYAREPDSHTSVHANAEATSAVDNESVAGSHSSRSSGRLRSQANTASRIMPPPANGFKYSQSGFGTPAEGLRDSTRHTTYGKTSQAFGGRATNVSDSTNRTGSLSGHTNRHYDPRQPQQGLSQSLEQGRPEKRKSSVDQTEKDSAIKKQRTRSQSRPLNLSSDLPGQPPYTSGMSTSSSRQKAQKPLLYTQADNSTSSRSKTPVASSRVRGRISRQAPSSGGAHSPRGKSSSQVSAGGPTRRSSTRLTRSQSRNGTAFGDGYNDRFSQELD